MLTSNFSLISGSNPKPTIDNDNQSKILSDYLNPPTSKKILYLLQDFNFDNLSSKATIKEAERIMQYIGVNNIQIGQRTDAEPFLYGLLKNDYAITIWVGTYGKTDRYGVRFGKKDYNYVGNNDSYFEIIRP
jgi:hypothetical protein